MPNLPFNLPFSLPFTKKKQELLLGLDIGTFATKVVKLVKSDAGPVVDFAGLVEAKRSSEQFQSIIHDYLVQNKLTGWPTATCLNDATLKIRKIELPSMPAGDLKEAVRWKMRDVVDGNVEEYNVRHSILEEYQSGETKKVILVGYAIKKDVVNANSVLIRKLGLLSQATEPSVVSLASAIESCYPSENEWIAGVDLGASKALVSIIGKGKFYFSRPLPGIRVIDSTDDPQEFIRKVAAEIQNTLDTFAVSFHVEKINRIVIAGGGGGILNIAESLTSLLAIPTTVLNPFSNMTLSPSIDPLVQEKPYLFAQALSLAKFGS